MGTSSMTHLAKEEVAAQVLGVVQARFERPPLVDIEDILERAKQQARVAARAGDDDQLVPAQSQLRILRRTDPTQTE